MPGPSPFAWLGQVTQTTAGREEFSVTSHARLSWIALSCRQIAGEASARFEPGRRWPSAGPALHLVLLLLHDDAGDAMSRLLDYLIAPMLMAGALLATWALLARQLPGLLVVGLVVGGVALSAAVLERLRPERPDYRALDRPLAVEAAHFLINYQLGYALSLGALAAVQAGMRRWQLPVLWPSKWPLLAQLALTGVLAEMLAYVQHRLMHRVPWLWRFHALHHSGERLNVVRTGRFHGVDIGLAVFLTLLPLLLLGAPESLTTWVSIVGAVLGVLQHANIRMRTFWWLDRVFCTPTVHRHHHSSDLVESNANFGTLLMLFDWLCGTYVRPLGPGPKAMGIVDDPVPRDFWRAFLQPLGL